MNSLSLSTLAFLIVTCICMIELTNAKSYKEVFVTGSRPDRMKLRKKEEVSYKKGPVKLKSPFHSSTSKSNKVKLLKTKTPSSRDREKERVIEYLWPETNQFMHHVLDSELGKLKKYHIQNFDKLKKLSASTKPISSSESKSKSKSKPKIVSLSMRRPAKKQSSENIIIHKDKILNDQSEQNKLLIEGMDEPLELEVSVNNQPFQNKLDVSTRMLSLNTHGGIVLRNVNLNGLVQGDDQLLLN